MANTETQGIYIAYYGRPADPAGAAYWEARVEREGLDGVIEAFGKSTEFTERFGHMDNEALINAMYQRLFNRDADDEGLAFYLGKLDSGEMSLETISLNILFGAQNEDEARIAAKVAAADTFTTLLAQHPDISYKGLYAAEVGTGLINTVGSAWTDHWHEHRIWSADILEREPGPDHHPDALPLQFLSRLMIDEGVMDVDTIKDVPYEYNIGLALSFDETPVIRGIFNSVTTHDDIYDFDQYLFHDLQPGNYSIVLDTIERDIALGIAQLSPETGQRSKYTAVVTHDGVLNFSILEEMDVRLKVRGPVEDSLYTITITQTDTPYELPDWKLWDSRTMVADAFEHYYGQVFGVPPSDGDLFL